MEQAFIGADFTQVGHCILNFVLLLLLFIIITIIITATIRIEPNIIHGNIMLPYFIVVRESKILIFY